MSPIRALTGLDPKTSISEPSTRSQTGAIQAIDLHKELFELREYLKSRLQDVQLQNSVYYNRKHRSLKFKEGDSVLLKATHIQTLRPSENLDSRNLGPFIITRKINANAYELDLPASMKIHKVFHISLLSPFWARQPDGEFHPSDPVQVMPNITRQAESILDNRIMATGDKEYLIKWAGYDSSDNFWEPLSSLRQTQSWEWLQANESESSTRSSRKKTRSQKRQPRHK